MVELSKQQARALEFFLDGKSMREISLLLGVSYSRTINILNEILIKTGIKSRKELLIEGKSMEFEVK